LETKIKKMYTRDRNTIIGFMAALWLIICGVISQIIPLTTTTEEKMVIMSTGVIVCVFATAALIGVLIHIKNKKEALYQEDIMASIKSK